jgi:hypothetical protein
VEIQRKSRRVANSIIHLCLLTWKIGPDLYNHQIKTNDILYSISGSLTIRYLRRARVRVLRTHQVIANKPIV